MLQCIQTINGWSRCGLRWLRNRIPRSVDPRIARKNGPGDDRGFLIGQRSRQDWDSHVMVAPGDLRQASVRLFFFTTAGGSNAESPSRGEPATVRLECHRIALQTDPPRQRGSISELSSNEPRASIDERRCEIVNGHYFLTPPRDARSPLPSHKHQSMSISVIQHTPTARPARSIQPADTHRCLPRACRPRAVRVATAGACTHRSLRSRRTAVWTA